MAKEISIEEFELFKYAMIEENLEVQAEITKKLSSLAQLLGEEITREELLPFIQENIDFHDEILLNLAEQLKHFIPLVGGYKHSKCVFDLLVKLCTDTDEVVVREKSVETIKAIAEHMDDKHIEEVLVPIVENLAAGTWFTSKCSASALYATCYPKLSDDKKTELRNSFRTLIQDDSPIVRRSAALACVDLLECMEVNVIKNEFIAVFDNISQDIIDSVRVFAADTAIALAKRLPQNETEEFVLKTVENWCDDTSWRLRQRLAYCLPELQSVIPFPKTRGKILNIYQKLVKDSEQEVRVIAAKNLYYYCESLLESYKSYPKYENNFEPVFISSILPQIHLLVYDVSEHVRLALSSNILILSALLSNDCFKKHILPLVIDVLEHEVSMPFQANMLQNLNCLPLNVDLSESLQSIKKVIRSIIVNSQTHWRTRRSILVALMHIAKFSSKEYFSENLKIFYAALLGDIVYAIRRSSPVIFPLLAKQYGVKWASENILPYFMMFVKDCRYLYRFIPLFGITEMICPSLNDKTISYLADIKRILNNNEPQTVGKARILLAKVSILVHKISEKLEESEYVDMLAFNQDYNYKKDDIHMYAEDTMDNLKNNNDINVFSINEISLNDDSYLEGVLYLICIEFLKIIYILYNDPTENIKLQSAATLHIIQTFINNLKNEIAESWVQDKIHEISEKDLNMITNTLEAELEKRILEVDEEKIDTEIMDTILTASEGSLPDLGGEIPELECENKNIKEYIPNLDKNMEGTSSDNLEVKQSNSIVNDVTSNENVDVKKSNSIVNDEKTVGNSSKNNGPENKTVSKDTSINE